MPGYVIHLAVGKIYEEQNEINNIRKFEKGIIAPDLASDKSKSHYGKYSSQPDLNKFLRLHRQFDEYSEGYFLHLLTDYLFYNRFLTGWNPQIYSDYNKLNSAIMKRYHITIPVEIQSIVKFEQGDTTILKEDKLCKFIETVGKIDIRRMLSNVDLDLEIKDLMN